MHPLWLCLRFLSLPLEALPLQGDGPCVVFERTGQRPAFLESAGRHSRNAHRKRLVCGNPAAEALGLTPGQELGAAAAAGVIEKSSATPALAHGASLASQLRAVERNPRAERAALRVLAAAAYGFSSQVTAQGIAPAPVAHALWLEIGSSLRLFGGVEALCARLRQTLAPLGYRCEIGIAPTPEGAHLLAGRAPVFDRTALWRALEPLPIADLPIDADTRAACAGSGLRHFGEILALPLDALARRFTPAFTDYLGRVTGRLPDVRRLYRPPEHYRRKFELLGDFDSSEALRVPICRLLAELAAVLVMRDVGVTAFTLELEHEGGTRTELEVGLASPSRDPVHLQVLAQTRLEKLRVPKPVQGLVLRAERFAPVRVRQFDLFNVRTHEEDEWQSVVDRLRARLGAAAVQGLGLYADHRPEKSWIRLPPESNGVESNGVRPRMGSDPIAPRKPRPLWLLPEPRVLKDAPRCLRGPERIEGGWWDGADVRRDYYVAESGEGARLWVYREQQSGRWFLHGLWA